MWAAASCSVQLPPSPSAAFSGYVRWASSLGRRQSRWARLAREPVRESLLTLACEDNAELVSRFTAAARQELGDIVLHDGAREPLASLCAQSAQGTLPCTAWRAAFARLPAMHTPQEGDAFREGVPSSAIPSERQGALAGPSGATAETHPTWRKERWTALGAHLHAQLPPGAHEARLRAALQLVPSADAADAVNAANVSDANAALVMLMEGALKIASPLPLEIASPLPLEIASPLPLEIASPLPLELEIASPLQLELLARLRSLAAEGELGCHMILGA